MLFYSFLAQYLKEPIEIELKNNVRCTGILNGVDMYLNLKLSDFKILSDDEYYIQKEFIMCYLRGTSIKYIVLENKNNNMDEKLTECTRLSFNIEDKSVE